MILEEATRIGLNIITISKETVTKVNILINMGY